MFYLFIYLCFIYVLFISITIYLFICLFIYLFICNITFTQSSFISNAYLCIFQEQNKYTYQ